MAMYKQLNFFLLLNNMVQVNLCDVHAYILVNESKHESSVHKNHETCKLQNRLASVSSLL